jgi:hypothetical protein
MANILPSRPRQSGPRRSFAIVVSQYNATYSKALVENARRELDAISSGINVQVIEVPGAFEIPLVVQEIAARGEVDAVIALGVILEGRNRPRRVDSDGLLLKRCNESPSPNGCPSSMKCCCSRMKSRRRQDAAARS